MPKGKSLDPGILHAALEGLELQKQRLDQHIAEVRRLLSTKHRKPAAVGEAVKEPRPKLSAAARKRIAAVQKKRWAEYHKKRAASAKQ